LYTSIIEKDKSVSIPVRKVTNAYRGLIAMIKTLVSIPVRKVTNDLKFEIPNPRKMFPSLLGRSRTKDEQKTLIKGRRVSIPVRKVTNRMRNWEQP